VACLNVSDSSSPVAISIPSNPLFVPLAHVPDDVRDSVWERILRLALEVDTYKDGFVDVHLMLERLRCTRASIPHVSRTFKVIPLVIRSL